MGLGKSQHITPSSSSIILFVQNEIQDGSCYMTLKNTHIMILYKVEQAKFMVYRHYLHTFSDFLKKFEISYLSKHTAHPPSAVIKGRGLGNSIEVRA